MHLFICVFLAVLSIISAAEKDSPCTTPNGESAKCIPINSCRPIKDAIAYLDEEAIKFAKQSQCGYADVPLVCCGSEGKPTTPAPPPTTPSKPLVPPAWAPPTAEPIKNLLLPDSSLCGLQGKPNKVSGAKVTEIHEYPWLVALKYQKDDGTPGGFRCMGTLINQRYILTAAQCLKIPGYNLNEVRLGKWNFSAPTDCYTTPTEEEVCVKPLDLPIVEKISHPYYNNRSGNNDIALVRVEQKIKYGPLIRPICLPPNDFPQPSAGDPMEVTGWNFADEAQPVDVKLKANVTILGDQECDKKFPNFTQRYINKACIKSEDSNFACLKESGRPIFRNYIKEDPTDERQWYQEGIMYKQSNCDAPEGPVLYTRVARYINWILNNVKKS